MFGIESSSSFTNHFLVLLTTVKSFKSNYWKSSRTCYSFDVSEVLGTPIPSQNYAPLSMGSILDLSSGFVVSHSFWMISQTFGSLLCWPSSSLPICELCSLLSNFKNAFEPFGVREIGNAFFVSRRFWICLTTLTRNSSLGENLPQNLEEIKLLSSLSAYRSSTKRPLCISSKSLYGMPPTSTASTCKSTIAQVFRIELWCKIKPSKSSKKIFFL